MGRLAAVAAGLAVGVAGSALGLGGAGSGPEGGKGDGAPGELGAPSPRVFVELLPCARHSARRCRKRPRLPELGVLFFSKEKTSQPLMLMET